MATDSVDKDGGVPWYGKLTPHTELIFQLRKNKPRPVSYRAIAEVLLDKCKVRTTRGNIYNFVKVRSKKAPSVVTMLQEFSSSNVPSVTSTSLSNSKASEDKWAKLKALKNKPTHPGEADSTNFDESKPLL